MAETQPARERSLYERVMETIPVGSENAIPAREVYRRLPEGTNWKSVLNVLTRLYVSWAVRRNRESSPEGTYRYVYWRDGR